MPKVLVVATSRKTRGGITSVVKAHETGTQWKDFHCKWVQTHRDGPSWRKLLYLACAMLEFLVLVPFYDIVHIHVATTQSAKRKRLFFEVAKLFRKKIIFHFHPSNEKFLEDPSVVKLYQHLFKGADLVLVLSEQWRRWLRQYLGDGIWMDKVSILYNPCPEVHRDYSNKKKQILYAGTLLRRKGYHILLKSFAKIANKYPEWSLAFAGNPYLKEGINEREDGERIAKELNISNQVRWLGWISGIDKERVFNESSIYCLASDGEGFPMGVLDAWAYGIPCVMTPVGGIPDIVINEKNGLIFPVGDIDQLANCLDLMIRNNELRESIVQETDKYVNGEFNIVTINKHLAEIYKSLVS